MIDAEDNDAFAAPFTLHEITEALNLSANNKSPGCDGIIVEFYKTVWDEIGTDVTKMLNIVLKRAKLCFSHTMGLVVLVPKCNKPKSVDDYRPITLLNADFKLLTRAITMRLCNLASKLIHPMQVRRGGVRNINAALCDLRDLINCYSVTKRKGCLLALDFKGAFNSLRHDYLFLVLKKRGFAGEAIKMFQTVTGSAKSRIVINGALSASFPVQKSVRQGCPLSAVLFAIALSPLVANLCRQLEGLTIGVCSLAVSAYADDVVMTLRSLEESKTFSKVMTEFSAISGLELNEKKTKVMTFNDFDSGLPFNVVESIKILGIVFTKKPEEMYDQNWPVIVNSLKGVLTENCARQLNVLQRVWVLKSYSLSKLWYTAQIIPPPKKWAEEVRKAVYKFIWGGFCFKTSFQECCRPVNKGGLGMIDPGRKCNALFCGRWLKVAFCDEASISKDWLCTLSELYPYKEGEKINKLPKEFFYYKQFCEIRRSVVEIALDSNIQKGIYEHLMKEEGRSRIETKFPDVPWSSVYENMANKYLPSEVFSLWYFIVHDIYPSKVRLKAINKCTTDICDLCGNRDTIVHRLTECCGMKEIWVFIKKLLAVSTNMYEGTFKQDIFVQPGFKHTTRNLRFTVWLLGTIVYVIITDQPKETKWFKILVRERMNKRARDLIDRETLIKLNTLLFSE